MRKAQLKEVWVDLRPMLPGGGNGGAKPFILNLVQGLADQYPTTLFYWSLQHTVAQEQAGRERSNLRFHSGRKQPSSTIEVLFCPFGPACVIRKDLPTASCFYDLQCERYPQFFTALERRQRRRNIKKIQREATSIAAISEFSKREGLSQGIEEHQCRAIPIQIRVTRSKENISAPGTKDRYLLYPANLWPHKNHALLFTAFAMAVAQGLGNDIHLICTGDGHQQKLELEALARDLKINNQVTLAGFVDQQELDELMHNALGVVFPSLYEGFGMPIIEAMAQGIPVCCSNNTALAEVSGNAALHFDPRSPQQIASALIKLGSSPDLRAGLIEAGYNQAKRYTNPEKMVEDYWQMLNDTAASWRRG